MLPQIILASQELRIGILRIKEEFCSQWRLKLRRPFLCGEQVKLMDPINIFMEEATLSLKELAQLALLNFCPAFLSEY
jgi:hypothetical protein